MTDELMIFISSKMVELAEERQLLYEQIPKIGGTVKPWAYERDAVASNKTIRDVYLNVLKNSWLYIGILWNEYGEWTIDEFLEAEKAGIPRLLFVKDVDTENRDKRLTEFINKQQGVTTGIAPKWFKTSEELLESVEKSIRTLLNERVFRPSSPAELITDPDLLIAKHYSPRRFIGRQGLIQQAQAGLTNPGVILLQGFSGMGKTALAGHLAVELLEQKSQSKVAWMRVGNDSISILYEQLAHAFNAQEAIAKAQSDTERQQILRNLLKNIGLLILDDVWNGKALFELIQVIPRNTSLIVTSRQYFPLDGAKISVDSLSTEDALAMLGYYAGLDFTDNQAAVELCELLGNHTYALEIAGRTLADPSLKLTPQNLTEKIKHNPSEMAMPSDFVEEGRESIKNLLDVSFNALDENAQRIFLAFGAMFAPSATPELLTIFRPQHKDNILLILDTLDKRGLVTLIPDAEEAVAYYQVHDLAHSYARSQMGDVDLTNALHACLNYTYDYNEPSPANFRALYPELDNFLRAAEWAFNQAHFSEVEDFAQQLYRGSEILDYHGLYTQSQTLLQNAAMAAEKQNNPRNQSVHLSNLGITYALLGQYEKAITNYTQALTISRENGDLYGANNAVGNLGIAYYSLGQYEKAIKHYIQVLDFERKTGDQHGEENTLSNLGVAYYSLGQYEKAIEYHLQALTISRETGNQKGEGGHLSNLANIYDSIGNHTKAIDYQTQALKISDEIGHKLSIGLMLGNLGVDYHTLGQYDKAIDYHTQAIAIQRGIGDRRGEGNALANLGNVYNSLEQYDKAIDYYTQAIAIQREIGNQVAVGLVLGNLGITYKEVGQYKNAIDCHMQSLEISREMHALHSERSDLGSIASIYFALEEYNKAIDYYLQMLTVNHKMGDQHGEIAVLNTLARTYFSIMKYNEAIDCCTHAIEISREIGDKEQEGSNYNNIALIYEAQENYEKALQSCEKALEIFTEIDQMHQIRNVGRLVKRIKQKKKNNGSNFFGNFLKRK